MLAKSTALPAWRHLAQEYGCEKIRSMEIYRFDNHSAEQFAFRGGDLYNCGLLKIGCGGKAGYAEYVLPRTAEYEDLVRWASVFTQLKGLTLTEAQLCVDDNRCLWGSRRSVLAEAALEDLALHMQRNEERGRFGRIWLERTFLMACSRAYYSF